MIGGVAGGLVGDRVMLQQYHTLEHKIEQAKLLSVQPERPIGYVTDATFRDALQLLESNENDELITIENRFFEKQHNIIEKIHKSEKGHSEFLVNMYKNELNSLYLALRDVKFRKSYTQTEKIA